MGLDASLYRVPKSDALGPLEAKDKEYQEIAYWRKFWGLQYWMERLYRKKGGEQVFDEKFLQLTAEDLDQLKKDRRNEFFDFSDAFFDEDVKELPKVIAQAKQVLKSGDCVYYWSSW